MARISRKMTMNRTFTLDTLFGYSIRFVKGEPQDVPPLAQAAAMAVGAEFADGEGVEAPDTTGNVEPVDAMERAEKTLAACRTLADRNNNKDFSAAGVPKVEAVAAVIGYKPSGKEVTNAWQAFHDEQAKAANP